MGVRRLRSRFAIIEHREARDQFRTRLLLWHVVRRGKIRGILNDLNVWWWRGSSRSNSTEMACATRALPGRMIEAVRNDPDKWEMTAAP